MRRFALLSRAAFNRYARIHVRTLDSCFCLNSRYHAIPSISARPNSTAARSETFLSRLQRLGANATQAIASRTDSSKNDSKEPKLELRRLLDLANSERKLIGFALAAQLVSASSIMLFPLALGKVVDTVTGTGLTDIDTLIAVLGGVFTVSAVASGTRVAAMSLAGSRISRSLRVSLFHSILRQETAFFDRRQSGELVNRLSSDVPLVSRTLTENIAKMLRSGITSAASLSFILYISPKLSLITLCSIPPIVGCAVIFGRNARKLSRELVDALASATQIAAERTGAIRTVRTFGAEAEESKRYADRVDETYGLAKKVALADGTYASSVQLSAQMSLLGVLWFGGRLVVNPSDPMTIGALTSFSMYAVNLGVAVSGLGTAYGQLIRALGAGHRVFEVIDREPMGASSTISEQPAASPVKTTEKIEDNEKGTPQLSTLAPGYDATVNFDNVGFEYPTQPGTPILKGVNLVVRPGEIVAIAGSSGSGKSTMSVLLSRLYEPTRGEIRLGDRPINDLDVGWLRSQIAVVSQEPVLFNGSVRENILYALDPDVSSEVIEEAARGAASHEMITSLPDQYNTSVGERGASLSGGQRARTALCRALVRQPRVLVLDEHSAALDAESERAVSNAVLNAATDMNMAVITIAHRTSSLRRAHKVAVLVDGAVAEIDSYERLMKDKSSYLSRMLNPRAA